MVVQQDDGSAIVGVGQAAHILGLRPRSVLRLINDGELPARKEFGRWRILRADVEIRRELGAHDGRRYAPAKAWGLIFLASGGQAPWLDRVSRWRIRKQLASRPWPGLRHALADRASLGRYAAHPDSIARLHGEPDLMYSGLGAAESSGVGVIGAGDRFEAYVPDEHLRDIISRNHLRQDPAGLVALRAVLPAALPKTLPPVAPSMAIALDLLEDHEPRARQVGHELLAALEAGFRAGADGPASG
ncbi:MAG: type IV toxin-antitoxin system AbiEi family antitoxin [Chloroflexota bacterium]|nr:type IV toxin-antitoxin system AbiEi family antitoxin [Chloroflexota bacterium]